MEAGHKGENREADVTAMIDFIIETDDRYVDLYLRLSRDDKNKGFSVSIENQDKMLTRFAEQNQYTVRRRYIDDGQSGYSFDRPDFDKLKEDILAGKVQRLLIKDMSRLGRHNAKALLFMEESRDNGCEVIALDDGYSNYQDNDCTIGIKTWHNELYVKESSKKVKNVIRMKQEEGEWLSTPPYGYKKKKNTKCELEIDPEAAEVVKRIFQMYADGYGILKIARILTKEQVPTPSRYLHEQRIRKERKDKARYSDIWNDKGIRRMLDNEIYMGTLVQRKGECVKIRGKYKQLPSSKWIQFPNHHEAIIDRELFALCQKRLSVKQFRSKRTIKEADSIFQGFLYCGDCGGFLSPYKTPKDKRTGITRYYCSTYHRQGKEACSAKGITDVKLNKAITIFLKRCRDVYKNDLKKLKVNAITNDTQKQRYRKRLHSYENQVNELKKEIKQLLENKMKEGMAQPESDKLIQESYQSLISEKIEQNKACEAEIEVLQRKLAEMDIEKDSIETALDVIDEMIMKQNYTKQELQILFQRIVVYDNHIDFYCKCCISNHMDTVVLLQKAEEDSEQYQKAIIDEIREQAVDGRFSLLKVHKSLVDKGYKLSYKGAFKQQLQELEKQGIVTRPYRNKRAIFHDRTMEE